MLIGIIGAPNKGKSTIFSAMTLVNAKIEDRPFTTISPNYGVAYVTTKCVDSELGVKCNPRNSICNNGTREIPVNVIDVAGLVPGAHLGKGMGNQFLNDLIQADALIQVVDLSGKTDEYGNPCDGCDPAKEVSMVRDELARWLAGILAKHMRGIARRQDGDIAIKEVLSGFNVSLEQIRKAAEANFLSLNGIEWNEEDMYKFSDTLMRISKPTVIAANKLDMSSIEALENLRKRLEGYEVIGCSGAIELALRNAAKNGYIAYTPGSGSFEIKGKLSEEQEKALELMQKYLAKYHSTGVQELINKTVFEVLGYIVVYPVEDESKYTDHNGNVLPDALLVKKGSTAKDLAEKIHSELAANMLYAINAKTKARIGKDYVLSNNDVIKIVSAAKR
ncbi:MAG: redox-regulated ATPase YchF [Candidatus Micrarchaeia archaeon]|jgi:ribosome-binding ATPase YchF (GTP1/OBG family)